MQNGLINGDAAIGRQRWGAGSKERGGGEQAITSPSAVWLFSELVVVVVVFVVVVFSHVLTLLVCALCHYW